VTQSFSAICSLDHQTTRPPDHQTTRPPDHQTTRPPDHQTTRPPDHQTTTSLYNDKELDHQTTRPPDHRTPSWPELVLVRWAELVRTLIVKRFFGKKLIHFQFFIFDPLPKGRRELTTRAYVVICVENSIFDELFFKLLKTNQKSENHEFRKSNYTQWQPQMRLEVSTLAIGRQSKGTAVSRRTTLMHWLVAALMRRLCISLRRCCCSIGTGAGSKLVL
jgi:hypothetical protein